MQRKIAVLVITSILALLAGFVPEIATTEFFYHNLSWFFMLVIALSAVASFWGLARQINWSEGLARHKPVLLGSLLLVGCAALLSPPDFRVLADETNLLGVSFEMHRGMKTRLPLEGLYYYHGMFEGLTYKTEMRPPGYPFLLSLLHGIAGYRPGNALALNLGLAWLSLILMYFLVAGSAGKRWGCAAMLLLAAFPAFVQSACSAGFEIYNLFLVLLLLLMTAKMIEGRIGSAPIISVLLLLAFSRYESIVGFICFVPLILFLQSSAAAGQSSTDGSGSSEPVRHLFMWAFPLLLVPAFWLRRLTFNTGSFQVQNLDDAFAAANFLPNVAGWLKYFTIPEFSGFVGPIVFAVAVIGLLLRLKELCSGVSNARMKIFEISTGVFFLLHLLIRLFYTQGNPMNPYTARLVVVVLPCLIFLAIAAAVRAENLQKRSAGAAARSSAVMIVFAGLLLIASWPAASGSRGTNNLSLYREFKWVRQQLARLNISEESILVCPRPPMYIPLGYSAIGSAYLKANAAKIMKMLEICAYNRLIFVEAIDYKAARSNMPALPAEMSGLKAEVLFETQMTGSEKLKITSFTR